MTQSHFEKVADYVMNNDGSELSMVKAERDYALHCLEREIAIGEQDRARIEALEAALREIAATANDLSDGTGVVGDLEKIARAALAPEQDK